MVELELPQELGAAAQARAEVDALGLDADRGQALKLVVSELVTNAVLHGTGPVTLKLEPRAGTVEGEVLDAGPGFQGLRGEMPGPDDAEGGRGLFLVDALCKRWEVDPERSRVKFEFEAAG